MTHNNIRLNIYIMSNWYSTNISCTILLYIIILLISNINYIKSGVIINHTAIIAYSICLISIIIVTISISIVIIEYLLEYYSLYINIILSTSHFCLIVTISEVCIVCSLVSTYIYMFNNYLDATIINDNLVCINIILAMVSNVIISKYYNSTISYAITNISINNNMITLGLAMFICVQLKEYTNYSSYINYNIYSSVIFLLFSVHYIHISVCSFIINITYITNLLIYNTMLAVTNVTINAVTSVFILVYFHLVSALWYIIHILV